MTHTDAHDTISTMIARSASFPDTLIAQRYAAHANTVLNSFDPRPREELALITLSDRDDWDTLLPIQEAHEAQVVVGVLPDYVQLKHRAHWFTQGLLSSTRTIMLHPWHAAALPGIFNALPIDGMLCLADDLPKIIPHLESSGNNLKYVIAISGIEAELPSFHSPVPLYRERHVFPGAPALFQCPTLTDTADFHTRQTYAWTHEGTELSVSDTMTPSRFSNRIIQGQYTLSRTCSCGRPLYTYA